MENILVVGATGTTGRKVIKLLKKSQYFIPFAMVRNESQTLQFEKDGIQTVLGDLEEDVHHTLNSIDKVVFAAGSKGKKLEAVDQEGAKKMISASEQHGVKKFVMLSSIGADDPERADQLQDYLKAKQNADRFLKKSHLKYTIVRPGALTNAPSKGKIEIAEKLDKMGEISRADVAQVLTKSLHDSSPYNITFEILEGDTLIADALEKMPN